MKCCFCGHPESRVIDSRPIDEGASIRRRRECASCGRRFTTYETIETVSVMVVKKDRSREAFDREKLLKGLLRACEKRPVPVKRLEAVVDEVEATVQNMLEREVTSQAIGEMVMDRLKEIDDVAYIRFASVYRQFRDIDSFNEEINKLRSEKKASPV
ncbi:MAG: transcriptional repressor NrdR [Clostridia bacterium]|nr:transcriptional repressor NrdR [Clostridia bacterium]